LESPWVCRLQAIQGRREHVESLESIMDFQEKIWENRNISSGFWIHPFFPKKKIIIFGE